jgi:DNA (cytosine-5)-methyltransferase 3A
MFIVKTVLSLFDGCSCGQVALNKSNIQYEKYFASEIDKHAIKVTQHRYPNTIQIGDVRSINTRNLPKIDLLIGGSPCTNFSMMGKRQGMITKENVEVRSLLQYLHLVDQGFQFEGESYLFWEFVRIKNTTNPKYFLLENVTGMTEEWKDIISQALGVYPIRINSSLLSAQNRERYYWTNIPGITLPKDKRITFDHIIPGAIGAAKRGRKNKETNKYEYPLALRKDGKCNCLLTSADTTNCYVLNGEYKRMTPDHFELAQTLPLGYTKVPGVSDNQRIKMIGNGWTPEVISHIFNHLKQD